MISCKNPDIFRNCFLIKMREEGESEWRGREAATFSGAARATRMRRRIHPIARLTEDEQTVREMSILVKSRMLLENISGSDWTNTGGKGREWNKEEERE
jgi:hypothetical protein